VGFLLAGFFAFGRTAPVGVGYGYAPAVEVGPLETARVLALPIGLNEPVAAGQVVVRMDPAPLVAQREVAAAALQAVTVDQERIAGGQARKFSQGVQSNLVDQAKLTAEDLAALATLQDRLRVEQDLQSRGASSPQAVEEWKRQISVVQARVDANRAAASVAGGAVQDARQRQQDVPTANPWEVEEATRQLDLVEDRIRRYDLASTLEELVVGAQHEARPVPVPVSAGDRAGGRAVAVDLHRRDVGERRVLLRVVREPVDVGRAVVALRDDVDPAGARVHQQRLRVVRAVGVAPDVLRDGVDRAVVVLGLARHVDRQVRPHAEVVPDVPDVQAVAAVRTRRGRDVLPVLVGRVRDRVLEVVAARVEPDQERVGPVVAVGEEPHPGRARDAARPLASST
jgi:hypothetical protein